jgi:hypothetical protein
MLKYKESAASQFLRLVFLKEWPEETQSLAYMDESVKCFLET